MSTPIVTPNVVIENPRVRKIARTVLDTLGAALVITMAVDASTPAFDLLAITVPVLAGWSAARTVFGLAVDNPNTPVKVEDTTLPPTLYDMSDAYADDGTGETFDLEEGVTEFVETYEPKHAA